jgi:hypothetical protein
MEDPIRRTTPLQKQGTTANGQLRLHMKMLLLLLALSTAIMGAWQSSDCDCPPKPRVKPSPQNKRETGINLQSPGALINGGAESAKSGETVKRSLVYEGTGKATLKYVPPEGAENLQWGGRAPDSFDGHYYVWNNVSPGESIPLSYSLKADQDGDIVSESVVTRFEDGTLRAETRYTYWDAPNGSGQEAPPSPPASLPDVAGQQVVLAPLWHVLPWIYVDPGVALTEKMCQDWHAYLASPKTFAAVRVPLPAPVGNPRANYPLPVVYGGRYSNTLKLLGYNPFATMMTYTVEYRPERFDFLGRQLPAKAGEHWIALGLSPTGGCPPGLPKVAGDWELKLDMWLDLDATPRVLPVYLCQEGQDPPPGVSAAAMQAVRLAGATRLSGLVVSSEQGEGITCAGPLRYDLGGSIDAPWLIEGPWGVGITRTHSITIEHMVVNRRASDMAVGLAHSSDLGVAWGLFEDEAGNQPLRLPITVASFDYKTFYLIGQAVPTSTAAGQYSLVVTATAGGEDRVTSALIWLGEWVAPPGGQVKVHLPTVMKQ